MSEEVAVSVKNLYKTFRLPHEQHSGIKQYLLNIFRHKKTKGYEDQRVLNGIDFEIKKGEFFGIVGRNGSGKSTLLKLLAGIYVPDKGHIAINGSLVPFIELGVGFNPELTGRENVYMNGALLGFSHTEVDEMYNEIVEFAELKKFMDQKLKNYSSGMQVRLAFSIAIRAESDVLVLDEVLAVGDEAFQRKCNDYFMKIKEDSTKTVILVTHGMASVERYCDRAMMIRDGEIVAIGDPSDVASEYSLENLEAQKNTTQEEGNEVVEDFKVELLSSSQVSQTEPVRVKVSYRLRADHLTNTLVYLNDDKRNCYLIGGRSKTNKHKAGDLVEGVVSFNLPQLNNTNIKVGAEIWDNKKIISRLSHQECPMFMVRRTDYRGNEENYSVLYGHGRWEDEE